MDDLTDIINAIKLIQQKQPAPIQYRLYYDIQTGIPLKYSVQDEEGDYIVISFKEYEEASWTVKVINKKIVQPVHPRFLIMYESTGGFSVDPYDWTVLVEPSEPHLFVDTVKIEDLQDG